MPTCPWTGETFKPVTRGGHEKRFASPTAKTEAHKAARMYCEALIDTGFLTWAQLREWYDRQQGGETAPAPSCTTRRLSTAELRALLDHETEQRFPDILKEQS